MFPPIYTEFVLGVAAHTFNPSIAARMRAGMGQNLGEDLILGQGMGGTILSLWILNKNTQGQ